METVLFIGLQASGKSSFYKERFFDTHARISLDLLKTRHREKLFFTACLETGQRLVVDNTNPTRADRAAYIAPAKAAGFQVIGYYFRSRLEDSMRRNTARDYSVPDAALLSTAKKLELPARDEGFDALYYVCIENGALQVECWKDEV